MLQTCKPDSVEGVIYLSPKLPKELKLPTL
jgi:hypothetical protein